MIVRWGFKILKRVCGGNRGGLDDKRREIDV